MKNFDIEKLERKNPYKAPENFFSEMQANVLKNTIEKSQEKPAKVFKLNFSWAIAAAVALVFGLSIFFMNNDGKNASTADSTKPQTTSVSQPTQKQVENNNIKVENTDATTTYETLKNDIATVEKTEKATKTNIVPKIEKEKSIKNQALASNENSDSKPSKKYNEAEMETMLANFSAEDLKQLSKNTDQDIYLDLYN